MDMWQSEGNAMAERITKDIQAMPGESECGFAPAPVQDVEALKEQMKEALADGGCRVQRTGRETVET